MSESKHLRQLVGEAAIVVAPGVYDALGALMVQRAGFAAAYLSGASLACTRYGRPDIGLVSMTEVADVIAAIADRVDLPLIADADNGYGNALNVMRTVKVFERQGAAAIQIEDQALPKRCGHLAGKTLVSTAEMVGKIKAALDVRRHDDTLIIARTDAIGVEGFEPALKRAAAYAEAGADMLFVEAPRDGEELAAVPRRLGQRVPVMANMVEGGLTPLHSAADLQAIGYALVIFPGGLVRAVARLAEEFLTSLKAEGSTDPFRERMLDFEGLNELIGTPEMLAAGRRYDGKSGRS